MPIRISAMTTNPFPPHPLTPDELRQVGGGHEQLALNYEEIKIERSSVSRCQNNLKQIGLAVH